MNDRLQELAKKLRTVPKRKFNYGRWYSSDVHCLEDLLNGPNTTGCALGWAVAFWPDQWKIISSPYGRAVPVLRGYDYPLTSAEAFFNLDPDAVKHLFVGNVDEGKMSPLKVLVKIQQFMRLGI